MPNYTLSVLQDVLQTLKVNRASNQVLSRAVERIAALTDWPGVVVLQSEDGSSLLRVTAAAGSLTPESECQIPSDQGMIGEVWASASSHYVPHLNGDLSQVLDVEGALSACFAPMKLGERVHALLLVLGSKREALDAEEQRLIELLADVLSLALQNARLHTTLQREVSERQRVEDHLWTTVRKTETLYRIGRSLIAPYQFDEILQQVMNTLSGSLHAHRTLLVMLDMEDEEVTNFVAGGAGYRGVRRPTFSACMDGLIGRVVRQGTPTRFTKAEMASLASEVCWSSGGAIGAAAMVPLFREGEPCGVLFAHNRPDQRDFNQQDTDTLMAIAGQIVSAIQNAELFQAVREERGRLRAVVQSSRDGVMLLSEDLRILIINRPALKFQALSGEPADWEGRPLSDALEDLRAYAPDAVDGILTEMARVRAGDESPGEGEFRIGLRMIHWLSLPVLGDARTMGRLLVLQDVTEARMLEQFREDLTHTMVHDLRNPLTGISASLKLLVGHGQDSLPAKQREILNIAVESSERMLKLVNAILDISRLESGRMPLNAEAFEIGDAVESVSMMNAALVEQRDLRYVVDLDEDLPPVWGDSTLIERVIQNLVSNALKFTPPGGEVRIDASAYGEPDAPEKLWVSVSDSGPGIPREIRQHLFQKFVSGQQKASGSGLGLAFCRMVMEAHNERIWVSKTSESGTVFTFTLSTAVSHAGAE